jgi:hypothetical protein
MTRFSAGERCGGLISAYRAGRERPRRVRLCIELLEERTLLSTLYVVPPGAPLDANHFSSYHDAYAAAVSGDVIQVQHGAAIGSVGGGVVGTRTASGQLNSTSITIDEPSIEAGELVTISGGGGAAETRLVEQNTLDSAGRNTLTLNQPLSNAHDGTPAATVTTTGTLGLDKTLTLRGDIGAPAPIVSPLEVLSGTTGVFFRNVNSSSFKGLLLDAGSKQTHIVSSFLTRVSEAAGAGSQGNVLDGNVITGFEALNGDVGGTTADIITNNVFTTNNTFSLSLINDNGAFIAGNRFNTSGFDIAAIEVINSEQVFIQNNTIHLNNQNANSTGVLLLNSIVQPGPRVSATIADNSIVINYGRGVALIKNGTAPDSLAATLMGNEIEGDIGVDIQGDGTNAGLVNLGDGTPGSRGGNNFRVFDQSSAVDIQVYAISLHNTSATATVPARLNVWNSFLTQPIDVIQDGAHFFGTGVIDVGTTQLTANEAYVQTLYHDFLGRTGSLSELDGWAALVTGLGGSPAVATDIGRSPESLKRLVDGFYLKFLERAADPAGEAACINFLQHGGTEEQLITTFLGSQEYADHVKDTFGGADASFILSLYNNLLGRNTSEAEVAAWVAVLPSLGRAAVVKAFLGGAEYRSNAVGGFYLNFLHETAPADQLSAWVSSPFDLLTIEITLTTSILYYTAR